MIIESDLKLAQAKRQRQTAGPAPSNTLTAQFLEEGADEIGDSVMALKRSFKWMMRDFFQKKTINEFLNELIQIYVKYDINWQKTKLLKVLEYF